MGVLFAAFACLAFMDAMWVDEALHERLALEGMMMAVSMLLLTALFECFSLSSVRHLRSMAGGKDLYQQGWWCNFYNAILIGVPMYVSVCSFPNFFIRRGTGPGGVEWSAGSLDVGEVTVTVLLHSLVYYLFHAAFHKVPGLFFVHQFHHRFRGRSVSPSTALAVSPLEFLLAYITAFGPGMVLFKPSRATLQASLVVVMGLNLLMHFPPVEDASRWLPRILVGTADHLSHHKHPGHKFSGHTLSYDYFAERLQLRALLPRPRPLCATVAQPRAGAGACQMRGEGPRRSLNGDYIVSGLRRGPVWPRTARHVKLGLRMMKPPDCSPVSVRQANLA